MVGSKAGVFAVVQVSCKNQLRSSDDIGCAKWLGSPMIQKKEFAMRALFAMCDYWADTGR